MKKGKKRCVCCGEQSRLILEEGFHPHYDIYCSDCGKKRDELPIEDNCVSCGVSLTDLQKKTHTVLCHDCIKKKSQEARAKGLCPSCFVGKPCGLPTPSGQPSPLCLRCVKELRRAIDIQEYNFKIQGAMLNAKAKR